MQTRRVRLLGGRTALLAAGLICLALGWKLLRPAATQLLWGLALAFAAMPVMRRLEKVLPRGAAAACSIALLGGAAALLVGMLVPALVQQARELAEMLPSLFDAAERFGARGREWLLRNGVSLHTDVRRMLLDRGQETLGTAFAALVNSVRNAAGSVGRWILSPLFAFYFLRDRRYFGQKLLLLLPVSVRGMTIRMLREMRRETAGYLRGQLMISWVIAALTAIGLLFCGVPAWLLLGITMGVLEWIPYAGPLLGGVLVALFSLPGGLDQTLWAIGVVVAVQQLEGSVLSPQLMSGATQLHPLTVILCMLVGGSAGGITGILLSVPLLLCLRAAVRVAAQTQNGV